MSRTIEISVSPERTPRLLELVEAAPEVVGIRLHRGASLRPPGDVMVVSVTSRGQHELLRLLYGDGFARVQGEGISLAEPAAVISPDEQEHLSNDLTDVSWEEMEFTIMRESSMRANALLIMAASGFFAAVGLATGALHLVIAAMVIAPGFEPIVRISLGAVARSPTWRRGARDTLLGYAAMTGGAALAGAVLVALGEPLFGGAAEYLLPEALQRHWTGFGAESLLVTTVAGAAGAILVASNRSILTAGVMIALALVPPVAMLGLAVVGGDAGLAGRALARWGVEVGIVAVSSLAVFAWKARTLQRRGMVT